MDTDNKEKFLPLEKVLEASGLKKTCIYDMIKNGEFPKSIPLRDHGRRVGWPESQVQAWIQGRIEKAQSRKEA